MTRRLHTGRPPADSDDMFDGFHHCRNRTVAADSGSVVEAWTMRADRCRMAVERVLPNATIELYINLGAEGRHEYRGIESQHLSPRAAWVIGPHDTPLLIEKEIAHCHIVGIRLPSVESERLLGAPAGELRSGLIDLDCFWGREVSTLRDRLGECTTASGRAGLLGAVVHARLGRVPVECVDKVVAVQRMLAQDTQSSVSDVARSCSMSHRTLINLVQRATGLKPKALQRVLRLRAVLAQIHATPRASWTEIALLCGFFDQAHLINDFSDMTGMTPREYEETRSGVGVGFAPYLLAKDRIRPQSVASN